MESPRKKVAHVVGVAELGDETRVLTFSADEPLGFVGGQFVSVDTGRVNALGKPVRRAYSLFSDDREQHRFQIAVKHISADGVSGYMHTLGEGDAIRFTGPWGGFHPPAGARGPLLVFATDTGITAALGLVRSQRVAPRLPETTFVWLRSHEGYFLPEPVVRALVPPSCREVRIDLLPPIDDPVRVKHARGVVLPLLARDPPVHGFAAGDGAVNYALLDDLVAAGVPATRDSVESFFNLPRRTAESPSSGFGQGSERS
jgi:NAD(P)H-flavin reductase